VAATKKIAVERVRSGTPGYWAEACKHLAKKDRVMKRLIPQFGDACLQSRGDAFVTLARSIVGQQISVKAAQTVWDRFAALPRRHDARGNVLKLKVDDMRAAGLSARKVEYLVDLALHFDSGQACMSTAGTAWTTRPSLPSWWHSRHRPLDGRDVPDLPPAAPQRAAAGRRGADQRHQPELFLGRPGQPQRCARGGRGLAALVQCGHLVYLALAGPAAGAY
jgi:hypothetical protein